MIPSQPLRKILIAYSSRPPILEYLTRAFSRLGIEVQVIRADENTWFDRYVIHRINKLAHSFRLLPKSRHLFEGHPLSHRNFRSSRLLEAWKSFRPDLTLLIRGINFRQDVLMQTRPLFGWWVEHEGRVGEALKELDRFDGYFFMNQSCVDSARAVGYTKSAYLAHAVDPDVFKPIKGVVKRYDACFVGNWSPKRQRFIEMALKETPSLALYGSKWLRKCWNRPAILKAWKGSYVEGPDLNRLYNESRLVLNVTNWGKGEGKSRSGMNMRVLEVPATGAFLLTDDSLEMADFVTPGEHLIVFDDLADFGRKIGYYLVHGDERERIAASGCRHVRERHTYDHVAARIVTAFEEFHSEAGKMRPC